MMNYSTKYSPESKTFMVIENRSGYIILEHSNKKKAKQCQGRLNSGMGFDGWTPGFCVSEYDVVEE